MSSRMVHDLIDHHRPHLRGGIGLARRGGAQGHEVVRPGALLIAAQGHPGLRGIELLLLAVAGQDAA